MQQKLQRLQNERSQVEAIIIRAVVTIQKCVKGWITRRKVKQVQELQRMFERAKLDEVMAQMQAQINDFAANAHPTP